MEKLSAIFFKDVEKTQFYATLKKLIVLSFVSAFLGLIDGGGPYFIPLAIGSYIVYQFYEEKQRIKFVVYFLPFIFFAIFFSAGGGFFILNATNTEALDNDLGFMLVGIWSSYIIILSIWALFKVQIKVIHFVLLTLLIPIPYLLNLSATKETFGIFFFYFLWNSALSLVLSLLFSQKHLAKQNL
ncbi:MAG: hypothetical protein EOP00_23990 [Pedobacter sp.]|nr:MAG: hypothetical protein EOP00_23990 [Pedobacter sp.]